MENGKGSDERRLMVKTWVALWSLALLFLVYGLAMFIVIGDKGSPDWDFSVVEDIPGKSVYSTYPQPVGSTREPVLQHVADQPIYAPNELGRAGK
jgi:hypothetical protein